MAFFRFRFDACLGDIFKYVGMSVNEGLDYWPVGATEFWVKFGVERGLKPIEAATLALTTLERFPVRLCISGVGDVICAFARRELIEQGADDGP